MKCGKRGIKERKIIPIKDDVSAIRSTKYVIQKVHAVILVKNFINTVKENRTNKIHLFFVQMVCGRQQKNKGDQK